MYLIGQTSVQLKTQPIELMRSVLKLREVLDSVLTKSSFKFEIIAPLQSENASYGALYL